MILLAGLREPTSGKRTFCTPGGGGVLRVFRGYACLCSVDGYLICLVEG